MAQSLWLEVAPDDHGSPGVFVGRTIARLRGRAAMARQRRIKQRDRDTCAACGRVCNVLEVDHIVPLYRGGEDIDANLQLLCPECHAKKTRRDLGQRERVGCDDAGNPAGGWAADRWRPRGVHRRRKPIAPETVGPPQKP